MKTQFMLLACYDKPLIPLKVFAEDIMGVKLQTAKNQMSQGTLPVPVTRTSERAIMVHIDDVANYIDTCRSNATA